MKNIKLITYRILIIMSFMIFVYALLYFTMPYLDEVLFNDFFTIDTCLDHGGRWNYDMRMCKYE